MAYEYKKPDKALYLKAGKELRVQLLIDYGFNMETNFYSLDSEKLSVLCKCMKGDGYTYDSPKGRSRLCSYWYALQRVYNRQNKN